MSNPNRINNPDQGGGREKTQETTALSRKSKISHFTGNKGKGRPASP